MAIHSEFELQTLPSVGSEMCCLLCFPFVEIWNVLFVVFGNKGGGILHPAATIYYWQHQRQQPNRGMRERGIFYEQNFKIFKFKKKTFSKNFLKKTIHYWHQHQEQQPNRGMRKRGGFSMNKTFKILNLKRKLCRGSSSTTTTSQTGECERGGFSINKTSKF